MTKIQLATLCYVKSGGKTLMLLRNKKSNDVHEGKWNGLGGKFQAGETPEDCVLREVREESGLTITEPQMRGILTFPLFTPQTDWMVFVFTADQFTGKPSDCAEGELRWIPDGDLLKLNLWEGDRIFLPWLGQGRFFSGKFSYKNKKLISHSVRFYDNDLQFSSPAKQGRAGGV